MFSHWWRQSSWNPRSVTQNDGLSGFWQWIVPYPGRWLKFTPKISLSQWKSWVHWCPLPSLPCWASQIFLDQRLEPPGRGYESSWRSPSPGQGGRHQKTGPLQPWQPNIPLGLPAYNSSGTTCRLTLDYWDKKSLRHRLGHWIRWICEHDHRLRESWHNCCSTTRFLRLARMLPPWNSSVSCCDRKPKLNQKLFHLHLQFHLHSETSSKLTISTPACMEFPLVKSRSPLCRIEALNHASRCGCGPAFT